jgi:cell division protein FtsL
MFSWIRRIAKTRVHVSPRRFRMLLMISILLMVGAMGFVWPNVKKVKMSYEYQRLAQEQHQLLEENQLLRVERVSLQSLDRIYTLAKEHTDLEPPKEGQMITVFLK